MWEIGSADWHKLISASATAMGLYVGPVETEAFAAYARELIRWNRKKNLTAITDPYEIAIKHFVDSIAPVQWIPDGGELLDIGSGGGFPGIPLKIMIPALRVTLIDASRKKVSFLKQVIRSLGLEGIEAHHARAEDFITRPPGRNDNRHYDVVISRALTALNRFFTLAVPLLARNGIMIAMKGKLSSGEIKACEINWKRQGKNSFDRSFTLTIKKYRLPLIEAERSIVLLRRSKFQETF